MTLFRWRDSLSVGVATIDRDHRTLIESINRLHFLALAGDDSAAIGRAVDNAIQYAHDHFGREETLMRMCGYPDLEEHRAEHQAFAHRLEAFKAPWRDDPDEFSVSAFYDALADWLMVHVAESDSRLTPYLKIMPAHWAA